MTVTTALDHAVLLANEKWEAEVREFLESVDKPDYSSSSTNISIR